MNTWLLWLAVTAVLCRFHYVTSKTTPGEWKLNIAVQKTRVGPVPCLSTGSRIKTSKSIITCLIRPLTCSCVKIFTSTLGPLQAVTEKRQQMMMI